ncbi:MAG TPA: DUF1932 domain-containing protein [Actinomycetaceae bacterium]|nr:DUF1932 domain-containing protein [Actinomycetaceae bacterium]
MRIAILGLGEAGHEIAKDLVVAGGTVVGYDPLPKDVAGIVRAASESEAVAQADLVLSVNSASDAMTALRNAGALPDGAIWADLNTKSSARAVELAEEAQRRGIPFVDAALFAPVPGRGIRTPLVASGSEARNFAERIEPFGATVEVLDAPVGAASARKLLRSVFYKGLAAAVVEALEGAERAGCRDWLYANIASELAGFDDATADRLVRGSHLHARRRHAEMAAATDQLDELGVTPRIAAAARDLLESLEQSAHL